MSETHEHLEHAEHIEHAGPDPLNRKVAFSMAIVAALLAGVSLLSHRAHNDTLRYQGDAGTKKVQEADAWSWYQAKRVRQHSEQNLVPIIRLLPESAATNAMRDRTIEKMDRDISKYGEEMAKHQKDATDLGNAAKLAEASAEMWHDRANWLDFAQLAVELGLVLCSITLLTKRPMYWYLGLLSTGLGIGLVMAAFTAVSLADHKEEKPTASSRPAYFANS
jgi:hypothetical protein